MELKNILVATDGSSNAQRALEMAVGLARDHGASITLVHAISSGHLPEGLLAWARVEYGVDTQQEPEPQVDMPGFGRLGVLQHAQLSRTPHVARVAVGRAVLEDAARVAREAGVTVQTTLLEDGDPADVIGHAISSEKSDLAMLGTRGLGTVKGLFMGSVAHKILGLRACPCLVVP